MPSPKTVLSDFDIHRMRRPTQTRTARSILEATDGGSLSAYDVVAEVDGAQHLEVSTWWDDLDRQNDLVIDDGKTVLRFVGLALRRPDLHRPMSCKVCRLVSLGRL